MHLFIILLEEKYIWSYLFIILLEYCLLTPKFSLTLKN